MNFCSDRKSAIAHAAVALVGDDGALGLGRAGGELDDRSARSGQADLRRRPGPASARSSVSTGFFFAAMIPLKEG